MRLRFCSRFFNAHAGEMKLTAGGAASRGAIASSLLDFKYQKGVTMLYEQINDRTVTDVIAGYRSIREKIYREILWSKERIAEISDEQTKQDIIESVSMPGEDFGTQKDISEVLYVSRNILHREVTELLGRIADLTEREETYRRIMACYQALPSDEHIVLKKLYEMPGIYKEKMADTARELFVSESSVKRKRRDAIDHILELYRLDVSNQDIFRWDLKAGKLREYR